MGAVPRAPIPFPLPEDLTGSMVGRFVVRSKVGAGGMGEVYCAEDTKLRRPVALKRVAHRLGSDPQARSQILREAQRASTLNSEHIASLHDVFEQSGELFLVMEYVEGETLRERMQRPVALEQFFQIATQCADALIVAHEHGIVHCDIKPENIMLTPAGSVKILDFGVAKHLPRSDRSSTLEVSRSIAGTPAYMAPEVLLENLPDARSDVFSLGVVFYELLTHKQPFLTSSFVATSERILHETPAPIRTFNPELSQGLEAVVMKAMAKAPDQRYANVRELLDDVRLLQGAPPNNFSSATLVQKHRRPWKSPVIGAVAIVALLAILFAFRWPAHDDPILAERGWVLVTDFDTTGESTVPAIGVREGLTIALQQSRYVNVYPRMRAYEVLRRMKLPDATRIDETLGREICQRENLQILLTGTIERRGKVSQITIQALDPVRGSLLFAEQERFDSDDQFFETADTLTSKVREHLGESVERIQKSSRPLAKVTTSSLQALQLYSWAKDAKDQGREEQVEGLLRAAVQLDPEFAMAHLRLGEYYRAVVGKNERALAEVERAYKLRQSVSDREQLRIEAEYYNLQERYEDEAQSLNILVSLYPDDEEAHQDLAGAYYDLNQPGKAIVELRQVLRLNPLSAPAYRGLVLFLARNNQAEAAITTAGDAQQRGVDPPQMHWGLGLAYLDQGNAATARQEFHKIGQGTETDRELQELCLAVADLYEGKLESAKVKLTRQVEAKPPHTGGLQTFWHYLLGRIYLSQGSPSQAGREAELILRVPIDGLQVSDLLNAGVLFARAGSIDRARQVLHLIDDARKPFPSSANQSSFHILEGELWLAQARSAQAENSLSTAIQEYPRVVARTALARAYQEQGRLDLAAQQWEQVLRARGELLHNGFPPDLAQAHFELARIYRRGAPDVARSHYEEILRMWSQADDMPLLTETRRGLRQLRSDLRPSADVHEIESRGPIARTK
jgi:tetratricopeptide (TPR) repeat protein/predicted Ser/Thr protein kinase